MCCATASLLGAAFRCISVSLVNSVGNEGGRGSLCMPAITYGKGKETLPVLYEALKNKRVFNTEVALGRNLVRKFHDCKIISLKVMVSSGERADLEASLVFDRLKDAKVAIQHQSARCITWADCNVESPFTDKLRGFSFTLDRKGKMSGEFSFHSNWYQNDEPANEQALQFLKGLRLDNMSMRIGEFVTPPASIKFTKVDGYTVLWEKC